MTRSDQKDSSIVGDKFGYWAVNKDGDKDKRLSNFTLKYLRSALLEKKWGESDVFREFRILKNDKPVSQIEIGSSVLVDQQRFSAAMAGKGPFIWLGNGHHLKILMIDLLKPEHESAISKKILQTGHLTSEDIWLFANGMIDTRGEWIHKTTNTTFPYESLDLDQSNKKMSIHLLPPCDDQVIHELLYLLKENIGFASWLALGWFAALPYLPDIEAKIWPAQFPLLFFFGRSKSGKSVLAHWLLKIYGIQDSIDLGHTTPANLQRRLAYYSAMPIFLNEFQNSKHTQALETLFLNAYDRTGVAKAERDSSQVRSLPVRAAIAIAGEHLPERPSLLNRCLSIRLLAEERNNAVRPQIEKLMARFPSIGSRWICDRQKNSGDGFLKKLAWAQEQILDVIPDSRMAFNYAVSVAALIPLIPSKELEEGFWDYLFKALQGSHEEESEHSFVGAFIRDIAQMRIVSEEDERLGKVIDAAIATRPHETYLSLSMLYPLWEEQLRRRGRVPPLSERDLRKYMSEEKKWIREERKRIQGRNLRVFTLSHKNMPEELRNQWCQEVSNEDS
jgi:hypothetical protein